MKISVDCALCIFQRGYLEILEATDDPKIRLEALCALFRLFGENFKPTAVPAVLGTMRERLIKEVTGNPDPFAEKKRISNIEALKVLPFAEKIVNGESDAALRFRKACLAAIVGNIMEFNIPGHKLEFSRLRELLLDAEKELVIDDIPEAYRMAQKAKRIIYLTDNAGEIAFDTLLVKELKNLAVHGQVIVAVKGKPAYNDATMEDALFFKMDKAADLVTTIGTDTMGLIPSECSREFLDLYESADFVVAKGMAYAETLTELELKAPHFLLLRSKCMNVANFFHVPRNRNIAKII
ncbi:DUF89 family protein [Candidatus Bathyarchaeota archaeon]|nr:MAG: DUF89 family protein [Candidatus Bathyarchaeota archaeon]